MYLGGLGPRGVLCRPKWHVPPPPLVAVRTAHDCDTPNVTLVLGVRKTNVHPASDGRVEGDT
jgi:hypothetical protein